MNNPDLNAAIEQLKAIDKEIALKCATSYMKEKYPDAQLIWGTSDTPPQPDELDQVWQVQTPEGDRLVVVTATAGELQLQKRQITKWLAYWEGTRPYVQYAIRQLRQHNQTELAERVEQELYFDRLIYLHLHTPIEIVEGSDRVSQVQIQQLDLNDDRSAEEGLDAVRRRDGQLDALRQAFSHKALTAMIEEYWQLDWEQKALLIILVGDIDRPVLKPIMRDTLDMPDFDDNTRWARATAACYFEGSNDRFSAYYNDSDLLNPVIKQIKSGQDADRNR